MERLTNREFNPCETCDGRKECAYFTGEFNCACEEKEYYDRLADYEDTGLEPEEIVKMGMMFEDSKRYSGRLEGRLKAYGNLGPIDRLRELAQADREGRCVVLPCAPDEVFWEMHGDIPAVSRFDGLCRVDENMNLFYTINGDGVKSSEIGKTVFLTREEAEQALKEAERND